MASIFIVSSEQTNSITLEANSTTLAVGGGAVGVSTTGEENNIIINKEYTENHKSHTTGFDLLMQRLKYIVRAPHIKR